MISARPMTPRRARLHTVGSFLPEGRLTNADLERMVDTDDEWIMTRTGIRERRIATGDETTLTFAEGAARDIIARSGIDPKDIDAIIIPTATPEGLFPMTSTLLQDRIGATNAAAYDCLAACSGFVYGLAQAFGFVESGLAENVLVIGAETLTRFTNFEDRTTCVLFGDGAGGALVTAGDDSHTGFLGFDLGSDGSGGAELGLPVGGSRHPANQPFDKDDAFIFMNGRVVFKFATRVIVESTTRVMERAGVTPDDIDLFIPHQANVRIIDHAVEKLGIDPAKVVVNLETHGNTSSASVPIALDEARQNGRLKPGSLILMMAFGAGLTWGSTICAYEPPETA